MWELRHRDEADAQYRKDVDEWLRKKGRAPLRSEPDPIFDDLIPIWRAWHDLGVSRPSGGFSVSGIPWVEMSRYCEDNGINGAMRLRWIRLLRAMDLAYLGEVAKQSKARR